MAIVAIALIVIYYLLAQMPLDPQVRRIVNIGLVVVAAIIVIWIIASLTGVGHVVRVPAP